MNNNQNLKAKFFAKPQPPVSKPNGNLQPALNTKPEPNNLPVIDVNNLHLGFEDNLTGKIKKVLRGVNLKIYAGEKISIIGESGSGKTVLSSAIACLLPKESRLSGSIKITGKEVVAQSERQIKKKKIRGSLVSYVFQNPLATMNPYLKIGSQLLETLTLKKVYKSRTAAKKKVLETLRELNLPNPERVYNLYPHQLSGGMIQRVVIACSLLLSPKVLILDEPTSALDVVVELQIIQLLNEIAKRGTTIILVSHDLNLVSSFSDKIAVMYAGKIIEYGTVREINLNPQHPYTWGLLMAIPKYNQPLYSIPGRVPSNLNTIQGDAFALRNFNYALNIDFDEAPPFYQVSPTHLVASWLLDEQTPAYNPPEQILKRWAKFAESQEKNSLDKKD